MCSGVCDETKNKFNIADAVAKTSENINTIEREKLAESS